MYVVRARLAALDPEAGAAIGMIERFDGLIDRRTDVGTILLAVTDIAGCPARFVDVEGGRALRAKAGRLEQPLSVPDDRWLSIPVAKDGPPALWLERPGPCSLTDAMVLDRAAFALRDALRRERSDGAAPGVDVAEALTVLLDAGAPEPERLRASDRIGLSDADVCRVIARPGMPGRIEILGPHGRSLRVVDAGRGSVESPRTGIGPTVPVMGLPQSWDQALVALAFAAEGDEHDPGPSVVPAEELGSLTLLAAGLRQAGGPVPDVATLNAAAAAAPWVLETLTAIVSHTSVRLAAAALFLHHSTLTARLVTIERLLGWSIREAPGRLRVQL
ncbi:helix-turn-helix domain-containing protein, partial [Streptomyces sp. NPDC057199]|uniref:helix-turn-helix domain-containing protein n=1 Tax=Streptomyces sp. NPDC057199 TaxID=3346047 RepID=UPI003635F139